MNKGPMGVIQYVAEFCGCDAKTLMRRRRRRAPRSISRGRSLSAWVLRRRYHMGYAELGELFGRDWTTIISAVRKVDGDDEMRKVAMTLFEATNKLVPDHDPADWEVADERSEDTEVDTESA